MRSITASAAIAGITHRGEGASTLSGIPCPSPRDHFSIIHASTQHVRDTDHSRLPRKHTLSQKLSATSFASCTSSASPTSSAFPTCTSFALPPSPALSSVLASTDMSGEELQVPPARPHPRKQHQSTPQSGAASRLTSVNAMVCLSGMYWVICHCLLGNIRCHQMEIITEHAHAHPHATAPTGTAAKANVDQDPSSIPTFELSPCHAGKSGSLGLLGIY